MNKLHGIQRIIWNYMVVRNEFKNIQDSLQAQIVCQGHAPTAAGKNIPHDFRSTGLLVVAVVIVVSRWCPTHPDGIILTGFLQAR